MNRFVVDVVIPALNEAEALPHVLRELPRPQVRRVVVVDNGSDDGTAAVARQHGAEVAFEGRRGYGAACLRGLSALAADPPDAVVFLDGDHSDHPAELPLLLAPIQAGAADLVIGSRTRGVRARGALTPQQRIGNWIACLVLRWVYGARYTDLGPFRVIRWVALEHLRLGDPGYGWPIEMQVKAARAALRHAEVPVSYRARIGRSKISGTVRGMVGASCKIIWVLARHAVRDPRPARPSDGPGPNPSRPHARTPSGDAGGSRSRVEPREARLVSNWDVGRRASRT